MLLKYNLIQVDKSGTYQQIGHFQFQVPVRANETIEIDDEGQAQCYRIVAIRYGTKGVQQPPTPNVGDAYVVHLGSTEDWNKALKSGMKEEEKSRGPSMPIFKG